MASEWQIYVVWNLPDIQLVDDYFAYAIDR